MNDDTISRQAAIATAISGRVRTLPTTEDGENWIRVNEVRDSLLSLPSAERRGRWIRTGEDGYCSICNCDMPMYKEDWEWRYLETPYCPNCGARMEGEA